MELWLSYDTKHNKIVFEDSTCDYNKNVYTGLVLSSIVLLMFFIAVQVLKNEESANTTKAMQAQIAQLEAEAAARVAAQPQPALGTALSRGQRALHFRFER